jgi:hypothetical protein
MQTFRRLNDPERYYGLSVRGWVLVAAGVGVMYIAVRLSPLAVKPTISITLIARGVRSGDRPRPIPARGDRSRRHPQRPDAS